MWEARHDRCRFRALALASLLSTTLAAQQAPPPTTQESVPAQPIAVVGSKAWVGRESEVEEYLKTAKVVKVTDVPVGVTKPRRAYFEPGGPAGSIVFKPLMPSRKTGFWESYKSEIAAYELDKILGLGMVPPTVERKIKGEYGSAQFWVEHCTLLRERDTSTAPDMGAWNRQVYRQRVWDNLIANIDRNQGNLLVDQAWNLILIDHSRAFTATMQMPFPMRKIDRELYEKLKGLDDVTLKARLGKLLLDGPKPILKRRDKIVENFEKLIAQYGEAAVLIP
jgi:hypothetical protein